MVDRMKWFRVAIYHIRVTIKICHSYGCSFQLLMYNCHNGAAVISAALLTLPTNFHQLGFLCSLISLRGSLSTPEKATSSSYYWTASVSHYTRTVLFSLPHLLRTSRQGSRQRGYSTEPPHSSAVLLPLAVISLSHWSMIHVCEGLGLLARCTAARCRHCAAAAAPVIMTGLARSLTCDGYVHFSHVGWHRKTKTTHYTNKVIVGFKPVTPLYRQFNNQVASSELSE